MLDVQEQALVAVVAVEWSLQVHHQVDLLSSWSVMELPHCLFFLLEVSKPANGLCSPSSLDSADYAKNAKNAKNAKMHKMRN